VYGDGTLANGATAAMAFSSQSVTTLLHAGAAAPSATPAPIVAAQTEQFIVKVFEAGMFSSRELMTAQLHAGENCAICKS